MTSVSRPRALTGWFKSKITGAVVSKLVRKFGIPKSAVRNLRSWGKLSQEGGGGFPTELLPLGANMWSGFVLTTFARQLMGGWVLPYWLRRQGSPASPAFVPHGHAWLTQNLTGRNWTGIGICGFPNEAIVDPRGLVTPWPFAPSIDVWMKVGDELHCPSERDEVEQALLEGFPIVRTSFEAGGLECALITFVAPLDGMPVVLGTAEVTGAPRGALPVSLVVSVRPYNPETICAVNELAYDPVSHTFTADGGTLLYLPAKPDEVIFSDLAHGDVAMLLSDPGRKRLPGGSLEVQEPTGLASAAAVYTVDLSGGGSESVCFACPLSAGVHPDFLSMLPERGSLAIAEKKLAGQLESWSEVASLGMRVSVPDEALQQAFDANKAFLLLLFDGQAITPGPSTYHMMWFRDAAYLVPALTRIGHAQKARDVLSTYPDRQAEDGFFRSHDAEWDSNGQAIWTLVDHYLMTGDEEFLRGVYPSIIKGARWIDDKRQAGLPAGDPRRGLLPAGVSAEHFGANDVYYWDDLWAVAGLRAAAGAARDLGLESDARFMDRVARELWASLEASWRWVEGRLGRRVIPSAPGRDIDAGSIGSVAAVHPLGLIGAGEEIMLNTVDTIVERCFYRDMHFHAIMHQGLNAYMSLEVAQCYLRRRDPYALKIFDSLWSMASPTFTYPEAINPVSGGGAYGDGHHGWAVAEFINFTRNLLLFEEGDRLVLLPVARLEWLEPGKRIEVEGAPTLFGEFSYTVDCEADAITFDLRGDLARPPSAIELNVPFAITSCEVDGETVEVGEGAMSVDIRPSAGKVRLFIMRG